MTFNKEVNIVDQFRLKAGQLHDATDYRAIFADANSLKPTFRRWQRIVHPDRVSADYQAEAAAAVQRLRELYEAACKAVASGQFGAPVPNLVLQSARMRHECLIRRREFFDMTSGFTARSQTADMAVDSIVKLARQPRDNELLATEASSLRLLATTADEHRGFYPELVDSFVVQHGRRRLGVTVTQLLDDFVNLEEVRQRYPDGISPLDMAWMWRRVLWALGGAHEAGLLHGALVPTHIMIHPAHHGVVLVDWCYSLQRIGDDFPPLRAVVGAKRSWYPDEVLNRRSPTEALDFTLAARSMLYIMGGQSVPSAMQRYFDELTEGDRQESAYQLGARFDTILERLGAPYYPRAFRPLNW